MVMINIFIHSFIYLIIIIILFGINLSTHVQKDFTISLFISNGVYLPPSFQIQQIYRHKGEIPCLDILNRPYSRTGVSGGQRSDKM